MENGSEDLERSAKGKSARLLLGFAFAAVLVLGAVGSFGWYGNDIANASKGKLARADMCREREAMAVTAEKIRQLDGRIMICEKHKAEIDSRYQQQYGDFSRANPLVVFRHKRELLQNRDDMNQMTWNRRELIKQYIALKDNLSDSQ